MASMLQHAKRPARQGVCSCLLSRWQQTLPVFIAMLSVRSTIPARVRTATTAMPTILTALMLLSGCAAAPVASTRVNAPAASSGAPPLASDNTHSGWIGQYAAGLGDVALHLGGNAPLDSDGPLLSSGFSFAGLDQRLSYSAGYRIEPGDFLTPGAASTWRADALPQSVGSRVVSQQVGVRLLPLYGAPVLVGAQYRQQAALLINGETQIDQQSVDVNWSPAFVALHLNWTPEGAPTDATQALQCDASGKLRVPVTASAAHRELAFDAGTRTCHVVGDSAALDALTANTWSTGMQWGQAAQQTSLQLQSVTPGAGANVVASEHPLTAGSGYALQLAQQRAFGDWQANGGVIWRRPPEALRSDVAGPGQHSPWAANAQLSRRLSKVSVAASWQRGDPYWFLPDVRQSSDNFALTVDFSPWASTIWRGSYAPTMALSYNWLRAEDGNTVGNGRSEDQAINWNLRFPWR